MKLAAIAGRGLRRDFWDLYEIARRRFVEPLQRGRLLIFLRDRVAGSV